MQAPDHKRSRTQDEEITKTELLIRWTRVLMKVLTLMVRIPVLAFRLILPSTQGLLGFMENNLGRMNVNELENLSQQVGKQIKEKNLKEYRASEQEATRMNQSSASSSTSAAPTTPRSRTSAGYEKVAGMDDIDEARKARQAFEDLPFAWIHHKPSTQSAECTYLPATYDEHLTPLNADFFNAKYQTKLGPPPTCECNLKTNLWMSHKAGPNYRRVFWRCPLEKGKQCPFFQWTTNQPWMNTDLPGRPVKEVCSHPQITRSGTNPFVNLAKCKLCGEVLKRELTELGLQKQEEDRRKQKQHFFTEHDPKKADNVLFEEFMNWKEEEKPTEDKNLFKEFMAWKEDEMNRGLNQAHRRGPPSTTRPSEPAGSTRPRRS